MKSFWPNTTEATGSGAFGVRFAPAYINTRLLSGSTVHRFPFESIARLVSCGPLPLARARVLLEQLPPSFAELPVPKFFCPITRSGEEDFPTVG